MPPEDSGYSGRILKFASRGAKNLFIAPIQEELSTSPLQLDDESFRNMPKADCQKCGLPVPLPLLTEHIKTCDDIDDIVIEEWESKNYYFSPSASKYLGGMNA